MWSSGLGFQSQGFGLKFGFRVRVWVSESRHKAEGFGFRGHVLIFSDHQIMQFLGISRSRGPPHRDQALVVTL